MERKGAVSPLRNAVVRKIITFRVTELFPARSIYAYRKSEEIGRG